jgi:hypothetical protein
LPERVIPAKAGIQFPRSPLGESTRALWRGVRGQTRSAVLIAPSPGSPLDAARHLSHDLPARSRSFAPAKAGGEGKGSAPLSALDFGLPRRMKVSAARPVLGEVPLAVVVALGVAPGVALAIRFEGSRGPVRIVILLLKLGHSGDDFDAGHCRILRSNRPFLRVRRRGGAKGSSPLRPAESRQIFIHFPLNWPCCRHGFVP